MLGALVTASVVAGAPVAANAASYPSWADVQQAKANQAAKQAEINRIRHGRTQAAKDQERLERERAAKELEGKRLEE